MTLAEWRLRILLATTAEAREPRAASPESFVHKQLRQVWNRFSSSSHRISSPQKKAGRLALAIAGLASLPVTASAYTDPGPNEYAILGIGSLPCFSVVKAITKTAQFTEADGRAVLSWAEGYLSFYNSESEGVYDVTAGAGAEALKGWLVDYCQNHPAGSLANSVNALLVAGYPILKPLSH